MKSGNSDISTIDGSMDFSLGVDSHLVTTMQSTLNPNGLPRNALSWLVNGTIRNGGISPRFGWQPLGTISAKPGLYQGGIFYIPDGANPILMFMMDGHLYSIPDINNPSSVIDLSAQFGLTMPPLQPHAYFCQAEEFLVVQAGDYVTLPLFWDGSKLTRSRGLISAVNVPGWATPYNQIPAAGPMCYYMGRLWYAQGNVYSAGDIVGSSASGTLPYNFRDSVIMVTENPLIIGGDGFKVPRTAGTIRWLGYAATNNTALGQGVLLVGTRKQIYGLQVPVTRADWIAADSTNMPLQYLVALSTGPVNDRSVVMVNSDLFFQTLQPSIQSLGMAVRNDQSWGDTPVSVNEDRILNFNNRELLYAASGIYFENRLLETAIPVQTPNGVVHQSIIPLNFDTISTLSQKSPPAWEGQYSGVDWLQLFESDFGGLQRAVGPVISRVNGALELWELTIGDTRDNGDNRIMTVAEFPALMWGREFELKELLTVELWLDDVLGTVEFTMEYRPDSDSCWYTYHKWKVCSARDTNETLNPSTPYPTKYGPGYQSTITLPKPPRVCNSFTGRPAYIFYQCQFRLTWHGWCRVRGIYGHAAFRQREMYSRIVG